MAKTKLEQQLDKETEELEVLNKSIVRTEQELTQARKELDRRIGRITLLQEQVNDAKRTPRHKKK